MEMFGKDEMDSLVQTFLHIFSSNNRMRDNKPVDVAHF